jgi:hypothetical protein
MDRRVRLTPLGAVLLVVLVASLLALFLGPRGVQAVGFTVATIVVLILIGEELPRRMRLWWVGQAPGGVDARHHGVQRPSRPERDRDEPGSGRAAGE